MTALNQGFEYQKQLGPDAARLSVIEYLTRHWPRFTREEWLERIESGRILLDGIPAGRDVNLRPGQLLSWLRPPWVEPEVPECFAILYQDDYLLAVAKPRGLPTNPGGGCFMEHTLLSLVLTSFPRGQPAAQVGPGNLGDNPVFEIAGRWFTNTAGMERSRNPQSLSRPGSGMSGRGRI